MKLFNYLILIFVLLTGNAYAACRTDLAATTSATQSNAFSVDEGRSVTLVMYTATWVAAEYGDIQISHDGGSTWQDFYYSGSQYRLHSTNRAEKVHGPGTYRVDKETTTNAAGIFRCYKDNL